MSTYEERQAIIEACEARMIANAQKAAAYHAQYLRVQSVIDKAMTEMIAEINKPLLALAADIRAMPPRR